MSFSKNEQKIRQFKSNIEMQIHMWKHVWYLIIRELEIKQCYKILQHTY
jgi:hypothetical protein